jgi:hypothetical protein
VSFFPLLLIDLVGLETGKGGIANVIPSIPQSTVHQYIQGQVGTSFGLFFISKNLIGPSY